MKNVKKGFKLTDEEILFLEKKLRCLQGAKNSSLRNRVKAILLIGGKSPIRQKDAAKICKVNTRTISSWLAGYRKDKFNGLIRKIVPGRPSKINDSQKEELYEILQKSPESYGYQTGIWTAPLVMEVIYKRFNIEYSQNNTQYLLKHLGFSFKLPKKNLPMQMKSKEKSGWKKH